jgi:hypothetical protein
LEIGIIIVGTFLGKNEDEQHVKTKTETIAHCERKGKLKGTDIEEGDAR